MKEGRATVLSVSISSDVQLAVYFAAVDKLKCGFMESVKIIKCSKCLSENAASMSFCRYCHRKFSYSNVMPEKEEIKETDSGRKLIIAGGAGLLLLLTGYLIFK